MNDRAVTVGFLAFIAGSVVTFVLCSFAVRWVFVPEIERLKAENERLSKPYTVRVMCPGSSSPVGVEIPCYHVASPPLKARD